MNIKNLVNILSLLSTEHALSFRQIVMSSGISERQVDEVLQALSRPEAGFVRVLNGEYVLNHPIEFLDSKVIALFMQKESREFMHSMSVFSVIDSTNRYLEQQEAVPGQAVVCLAEQQTQGRGRRGRSWESAPAAGIYCSIKWRFSTGFSTLATLSLMVGVELCKVLRAFTGRPVMLKWPNDLVVEEDGCLLKLGGILIELSGSSEGPVEAIIGFGVNSRLPLQSIDKIEQATTDLCRLNAAIGWQRNKVIALMLDQLLMALSGYSQSRYDIKEQWKKFDALSGKQVYSKQLEGIAQGVDSYGRLRVVVDGDEHLLDSGEVSVRLA